MIHIKFKNSEIIVTKRWLVFQVCVWFTIFFGGCSFGSFITQSQYSHLAAQRDKAVGEIKQKVDQIPDKTADKVKQVVEDAPK